MSIYPHVGVNTPPDSLVLLHFFIDCVFLFLQAANKQATQKKKAPPPKEVEESSEEESSEEEEVQYLKLCFSVKLWHYFSLP